MALYAFPPGFLWGAATASYQIEGGHDADGRGESIWDRFSHTPGRTMNGDTGDVACDHYHRYREDIALMRDLGLKAYRFSVAWPRIQPDGTGSPNQAGLDFYSRLVDGLLEAGITPLPTLYHWDLPQPLEDRGGWPNLETATRFAEYAGIVFDALGDRVKHWITLNEPWCTAHLGYYSGEHAPGRRDLDACLAAGHALVVAHGLAVRRLRRTHPDSRIGITDNFSAVHPATDRPEDLEAAARWDAYMNRWFIDPIFFGDYPAELRAEWDGRLPRFTEEQRDIVRAPIDFIGVNYYSRSLVRDGGPGSLLRVGFSGSGLPRTAMGWEIYPDGLYEVLTTLRDRYANPLLYVTENGAAFDESVAASGRVEDEDRRTYLRDHFLAAHRAITSGVPLAGYFVWSLMDNFEWAYGFTKRFGIVHVDYATQKRTPKRSAEWYSQVIRQNAVSDD